MEDSSADTPGAMVLPGRDASTAPLVLASASPRRRQLLGRLGLPFEVVPAAVGERVAPGVAPAVAAELLALRKARAVVALRPEHVVIGADTVVALGGERFGKPRDAADALRMLRSLRGRTHQVTTGLAVVRRDQAWPAAVTARVRMRQVPDDELRAYIATGEPFDKAGAYAVQGQGASLIEAVEGSELAVVGLPVRRLAELLLAIGVALPVAVEELSDRW